MMTDPAASRPGTHLDPDQMADLFEGLLDPAAADEARAHLASCPLCSADFALIAGEADLGDLGELLPPTPIPHDVMARVEAALYREPPLPAPAAQEPVGHHAAAASAASPARRRRFRISLGALAGATLVIAGGIGVVTAMNGGGNDKGSSGSSAAAGRAPDAQSGGGAHADTQVPGGAMSPQVGAAPSPNAGADQSSQESIKQQAEDLLGQRGQTPAGTSEFGGPACLPPGLTAGSRLLGSTHTEFQGKPALLLVYSEPGSTTVADVYVIAPDTCTSGNPGQVVDHITVPRP
jgi:negative regulator of sigma E activity